ncbi:MAG: HD-GYP domain-containing protein [Sphaerobacter sp.]|nr:HD-GYP domain-containing protein [Sphaerobacter sp.]
MHPPGHIRSSVIGLVAVTASVLLLLGPAVPRPPLNWHTVLLCGMLVALTIFADFFDIDLPLSSVRISVSVSSALCFAAALALGPIVGALLAATAGLIVEVLDRRPLLKLAVNVSNYSLATFIAGWVYSELAEPGRSPIGSMTNLGVTIAAAAVYTTIESGIMALILARVVGTSPWRMWRASAAGVMAEWVTLPTLGSLIPVLERESPLALLIAVVPLLGPYLAFRSYRQIHDETRKTIEMLADTLDRRDPYTSEHSKRVAAYTEAILRQLEHVALEEAENIITAARIHDLGKVSTPDAALNKPGTLTPEEMTLIQRHVIDGAQILGNLSTYKATATIIRHHHERWDGTGYPDGLKGEEIPLGSRVIAVADTYDAMTSDRVYRRALPHHVAMAELRRCAGTQFDPQVVLAFERAMAAAPVYQQCRPATAAGND